MGTSPGFRIGWRLATASLALIATVGVATSTAARAAATIPVQRIAGADAIGTSIAVSNAEFPNQQTAAAAVLARSDFFSDALAGGPLAASVNGPLLITPGASTSSTLDPRVQAEIQRVLSPGRTVYILGGTFALSPQIDTQLQKLGYNTVRIAGSDEYATAVDVAHQLGDPVVVFEATGLDFQDALSAVPAAILDRAAILLTDGSTQAPETSSYLAGHPNDIRYAVGGSFAAGGADPGATDVAGSTLYDTAAAVALRFFGQAKSFGAATGTFYADALAGGVYAGTQTSPGPMLLVPSSGTLPSSVSNYLGFAPITSGTIFGGTLAVGNDVQSELSSSSASSSSGGGGGGGGGTGSGGGGTTTTTVPGALSITTASLPAGQDYSSYAATLGVAGGQGPYTWSLSSGSLPPGLSLSPGGSLSGTPTTSGTYKPTFQVVDSSSPQQTATAPLSITISTQTPTNSASCNWSGFQVTSGTYTSVKATFTVPSLAGEVTNSSLGVWTGIDGANNSNLIQAGIGEDQDSSSASGFDAYAWWEILPAAETQIPTSQMNIQPGDVVTVDIHEVSGTQWSINLTDGSQTFSTTQTYNGQDGSAEWIVEAPSDNAGTLPLASFTPNVSFTNISTNGDMSSLTRDVMQQVPGNPCGRGTVKQVATPSSTVDAQGFSVAYGSTTPAIAGPNTRIAAPQQQRVSGPGSSKPAYRWGP